MPKDGGGEPFKSITAASGEFVDDIIIITFGNDTLCVWEFIITA